MLDILRQYLKEYKFPFDLRVRSNIDKISMNLLNATPESNIKNALEVLMPKINVITKKLIDFINDNDYEVYYYLYRESDNTNNASIMLTWVICKENKQLFIRYEVDDFSPKIAIEALEDGNFCMLFGDYLKYIELLNKYMFGE